MTKKDEKDADRPHYYSQFWLDVAAGRKVIGAPKSEDGADQTDAELPEPIPLARKGGRANPNILPADGYRETRAPAAVADEAYDDDEGEGEEDEEFLQPEDEKPDTVNEVSDADIPTIVDDAPVELTPNIEAEPTDEEEEEPEEDEEFYEEEEEEEDEEEWPARGRKKPKPGRQAKVPKAPAKKPRRGGRF